MKSHPIKLSKGEAELLISMTDFSVALSELLNYICTSYPKESSRTQIEIARNVVLSLVNKKLVSLCCLTAENTKDNIYEVDETTSMTMEQTIAHLAKPVSWVQSTDLEHKEISYELGTTKLGEEMLDYLFSIKR
jgi:hypothetical protein